jgi:hypothetical protein
MPSKRTPSHPKSPETADPRTKQPIDIDDATIDETATVEPDEDLVELSNPGDDTTNADEKEPSPPKGAWRGRDANRRAHGSDDLKA